MSAKFCTNKIHNNMPIEKIWAGGYFWEFLVRTCQYGLFLLSLTIDSLASVMQANLFEYIQFTENIPVVKKLHKLYLTVCTHH